MPAYKLQKKGLRYYIVPDIGKDIEKLLDSNFIFFYIRYKAIAVVKAMNAAFNEGYRYCNFKKDCK